MRDPLKPTHVGKFGFNGPVLPFPGPTALMVSEGTLHKLDTTTFTEVASCPITCGGTPPSRTPREVVHAGTRRLAYIADQGPLPLYSPTVCIVEDPALIP